MQNLSVLFKFFALAFSALLPLVNPLGSALVFLEIVGNAPPQVFRDLAQKIAVTMIMFMAVVELLGAGLLNFFGISLSVVQIAGGLVLASMGWKLLNQHKVETKEDPTKTVEGDFGSLEEKVFYPLTFPITIGPGSIVVMLTLGAHASVKANIVENATAHLGIFLAVVALSLTVFLCYRYAPLITQRISPATADGILRLTGFVLLCIGVQITTNGVGALLRKLLNP
jgi:multiple antibiotic resistance protein